MIGTPGFRKMVPHSKAATGQLSKEAASEPALVSNEEGLGDDECSCPFDHLNFGQHCCNFNGPIHQ
jgi:hypothetical protein